MVQKLGQDQGTYIHAVSDGAPWIAEQVKLKFCNRSSYLIDFFHLYEYLSEAAIWYDIFNPWEQVQVSREKLKSGKQQGVFEEIANKYASLDNRDEDNGLRRCYKYMEKGIDYMNY